MLAWLAELMKEIPASDLRIVRWTAFSFLYSMSCKEKIAIYTKTPPIQGYYEKKLGNLFILFYLSLDGLGLGGLDLWLRSGFRLPGPLTHRRAVLCEILAERNEFRSTWNVFAQGLRNVHSLSLR